MLFAYANATCVALIDGVRSNRVGVPAALNPGDEEAVSKAIRSPNRKIVLVIVTSQSGACHHWNTVRPICFMPGGLIA